ncbi:hypothetical protein CC80DRAFT_510145 [Byssothecium circinans]|uniref:RING-type domain-containing protein n=1 Tax=Byssothecium circinans TaxID=147558 RepID=A0A6A5TLY3_9PLEO|nr:hypothetical protein CC80DRAFT_510145 [Byssothecium circinans]
MPPIPTSEAQIEGRLRRIRPLDAETFEQLSVEERTCEICGTGYSSESTDLSYPVYVEPERGPGVCRHIFCRRCVETLIRTNTPYSTQCPMCRAPWFRDPGSPQDGNRENWTGSLIDMINPHDHEAIERLLEAAGAGQGQISNIIVEQLAQGNMSPTGDWVRLTPRSLTQQERGRLENASAIEPTPWRPMIIPQGTGQQYGLSRSRSRSSGYRPSSQRTITRRDSDQEGYDVWTLSDSGRPRRSGRPSGQRTIPSSPRRGSDQEDYGVQIPSDRTRTPSSPEPSPQRTVPRYQGSEREVDEVWTLSDRGRMQRSAAFMQVVASTFDIVGGDARVSRAVRGVDRAVTALWQTLDGIAQERGAAVRRRP